MLNLTRFLILIAVAVMAARPVMACCLTGHGEPQITQASADMPPCHGEQSAPEHSEQTGDHERPSPADCPGCFDCDAGVMQAQSFDDGTLLVQNSTEIPVAILTARFEGFEHKSIVLKTGPPGDPPRIHTTPITLKQRLLI